MIGRSPAVWNDVVGGGSGVVEEEVEEEESAMMKESAFWGAENACLSRALLVLLDGSM